MSHAEGVDMLSAPPFPLPLPFSRLTHTHTVARAYVLNTKRHLRSQIERRLAILHFGSKRVCGSVEEPPGDGPMPEVISLHLGQCGTNIGTAFWQAVLAEHRLGLDLRPQPDAVGREQPQQQQPRDELQRASSFFEETSTGTTCARFCHGAGTPAAWLKITGVAPRGCAGGV